MATANPQGIMSLPAGDAPAQPQLGLDDSYDAVQQGLQNASPDAYSAVNAELAKLVPQLDQLPDEILDQLLQVIQYLHDNPDKYAQTIKELIADGVIDEGDLPEEYDPEFLATFGMVIMQARKSRRGAQGAAPVTPPIMPPVGMARGGIAEAVNMVASQGRGQDTMLAHINPREAQMLRSMGGVGTLNPVTGLPEYGLFKAIGNAFKAVGDVVKNTVKNVGTVVKKVVSSPVGRVLATVAIAAFIGPAAFGLSGATGIAVQMGLASGAVTALGGGSLKDVLKSAAIGGATGFFGAPGGVVSNFVGGAVTNAAANAAITSGIVGTGMGLLSGQKLQDAVKSGLTAGAVSGLTTGATKGFDAQIEAPTVDSQIAEMGKLQAGENIRGKYNPETGKFDLPEVVNRDTGVGKSPLTAQMTEAQVSNMSSQGVGTDGLTPLIDPATGGIQTVAADNNTVYELYKRSDGTTMFRPTTGSGANAPAFMKGNLIVGSPETQLNNVSSSGAGADISSSYTGQSRAAGMQPSGTPTDTGFTTPSAGGVYGGRFDGVSPVEPLPPPVEGPYRPPTLGRVADEVGRGEYGNAAKTLFTPETPTPAQVVRTPEYETLMAMRNPDGTPVYTGKEAIAELTNSMSPGIIRTYGPATAAGLGIAGLAGAFTPKQPEPSPEEKAMNARLQAERDRLAANPGAYVPQGLERFGIQYNERGEIIGSQPFSTQPLGPTEVAGNYFSYNPSPYMTLSGGIGGGQSIYQPYNTANMYTNLMPPQYRAQGGIASLARGGYPRRTGQISGPGTGTSDSIPAMLSDGEFVMTAKAVRGAGKGSRLAGAKKMYALMHQLERNAARG